MLLEKEPEGWTGLQLLFLSSVLMLAFYLVTIIRTSFKRDAEIAAAVKNRRSLVKPMRGSASNRRNVGGRRYNPVRRGTYCPEDMGYPPGYDFERLHQQHLQPFDCRPFDPEFKNDYDNYPIG